MKRPHRRAHFLLWLVLTPMTAVAAFAFWRLRPETPYADLPTEISENSNAVESH